ncbi:hypothetical protein [Barrientosiimonas endolithica]|uniref:Aminopeptidase N n=1 Tax=Barrientosiimonas endolithica TaxID=1535208 RepID=A0ABN6YHJ3_9MICO|nr:hypothetical protein [Barrientosiimonas endolithica]BDZ56894.1 hypothetical protein GCM10025872_05510 [Barrientosiimonas endolithica]
MSSLTIAEARGRADLIGVAGYTVHLDLDQGDETFASRAEIRFTASRPGASTFLDVDAREVSSITLNGRSIDPATVADRRVELPGLQADNTVVVEATMAYSRSGRACTARSTRPTARPMSTA